MARRRARQQVEISLYTEHGLSIAQIAERCGVSSFAVHRDLADAGVQRRPQGRPAGFKVKKEIQRLIPAP